MSTRVEVLASESTPPADAGPLTAVIASAVEAALDAEHSQGPDRVTVLLSDDARIRSLNRDFHGEDEVTDVLSFNEAEGWQDGSPPEAGRYPFAPPGAERRLGDIIISLPQARRQAADRGAPVERELAMLAVHGVLHLLGFDHADPDEEKEMFARTARILEKVQLTFDCGL